MNKIKYSSNNQQIQENNTVERKLKKVLQWWIVIIGSSIQLCSSYQLELGCDNSVQAEYYLLCSYGVHLHVVFTVQLQSTFKVSVDSTDNTQAGLAVQSQSALHYMFMNIIMFTIHVTFIQKTSSNNKILMLSLTIENLIKYLKKNILNLYTQANVLHDG